MKKVLKIFLIIMACVLVLFVAYIIRNFTIISNLQKNLKEYLSSTNYHMSVISKKVESETVLDYYIKDKKQVLLQEKNENGNISKTSIYNNGEKIISFYENGQEKVAKENSPSAIQVNVPNYFVLCDNNLMQKILMSITLKIKKVEYQDKKCYCIVSIFDKEKEEEYIDINTGLSLKSITKDSSSERRYEFNNVSENVFEQPDISQYTLK